MQGTKGVLESSMGGGGAGDAWDAQGRRGMLGQVCRQDEGMPRSLGQKRGCCGDDRGI